MWGFFLTGAAVVFSRDKAASIKLKTKNQAIALHKKVTISQKGTPFLIPIASGNHAKPVSHTPEGLLVPVPPDPWQAWQADGLGAGPGNLLSVSQKMEKQQASPLPNHTPAGPAQNASVPILSPPKRLQAQSAH